MRINRNMEPIYIEIILSAYFYHKHELDEFFKSQIKVAHNVFYVPEVNMKNNFIRTSDELEAILIKKMEEQKEETLKRHEIQKIELLEAIGDSGESFNLDNEIFLVEVNYNDQVFYLENSSYQVVKKSLYNCLFLNSVVNDRREKWFYVVLEYAIGAFDSYNSKDPKDIKELRASEIAKKIKAKYDLDYEIPSNYISEIRRNEGRNKNFLRDVEKVKEVYDYCFLNKDLLKMTDQFIAIYNSFN